MTRTLHIATAALALGAVAATALHTAPADAFQSGIKAAGDAGNSVHTVGNRPGSFGNGPIPAGPSRTPGTFTPPGGFGNGGGSGKFTSQKAPGAFDPYKLPGGNGGGKFPTPTGSQKNPGTFDPGRIPGNGGPGGSGKIPPLSGESIPNPNLPWGSPGNGGGNGGGNIPPIGEPIPNPNLPWGNPGQGGGGNKGPKGHGYGYGYGGGYVDFVGDGHRPCWWLRRKFQMTGNVYWLNRFRHCLWRHYGD
jgi:hypothetical protein